ncbi:hypothetical protein M413DRAFT_446244 [Hebeloma cylindrosporum]|uniref:Uncharacterized protein n=1 Tax=Hebeloma cylindrosporum TaxID=76867 RepID=A0A0C3BTV7_HEBCY|nr:hypothetical protein M413DRAFT_446244 [Hebeloma cylindrosporum h7]
MSQSNQTLSTFASAREEKKWNKLGEKMSQFHEWFKRECTSHRERADIASSLNVCHLFAS